MPCVFNSCPNDKSTALKSGIHGMKEAWGSICVIPIPTRLITKCSWCLWKAFWETPSLSLWTKYIVLSKPSYLRIPCLLGWPRWCRIHVTMLLHYRKGCTEVLLVQNAVSDRIIVQFDGCSHSCDMSNNQSQNQSLTLPEKNPIHYIRTREEAEVHSLPEERRIKRRRTASISIRETVVLKDKVYNYFILKKIRLKMIKTKNSSMVFATQIFRISTGLKNRG